MVLFLFYFFLCVVFITTHKKVILNQYDHKLLSKYSVNADLYVKALFCIDLVLTIEK